MSASTTPKLARHPIILIVILIITSVIALAALVVPFVEPLSQAPLKMGDAAPQDITAPYALTYKSDILTEQLRQETAAKTVPIYNPADPGIARGQLEHLRAALSYITTVRADGYATQEQQLTDISALENIQIDQETALNILGLSNSQWQTTQQEAIVVLEQIMRSTIRENGLNDARREVPALISLSLPEDQAAIVAKLVSAFVIPNSLYNQALTDAARQQARDSVAPVTRSFVAGETIIQRGKVISASDLETLAEFGLLRPQFRWEILASAGTLIFLIMAFLVIYLRRNPHLTINSQDLRGLTLITLLFLAYLTSARLIIPDHTVLPYIYPLASYGFIVATLFGTEPALITSLLLSILVSYELPNALELTLYYVMTSYFGILILGHGKSITSYLWSGAAISCAGIAVVIAYRLPQPTTDLIGLATLSGSAMINGVASAGLAFLLQFFLAQLLGMTTALQLTELSRPDHPLLQLLLRNAPGTYQHSLQVANLAEQAAERVGADPLLTRVGALYHDAGKAINPIFFIENQVPGNLNPHDDLDPQTSAAMIIRHIPEGLELARKYRLPRRIQSFIAEHHGTMIARYQYARAVEAAGGDENQVDPELFRYPGPRPQSLETALLMLADGCEARVRAEHPKDENELRQLIKSVIDHRVATGELDETSLTLHDLETIVDSFTTTLRGIYHPRIQYPKFETIPVSQDIPSNEVVAESMPSLEPAAPQDSDPATNSST